jgi:deoxyribodipyrimidine photo-lyase
MTDDRFPPTRTEGLARLAAFLPKAGRDYARLRNFDLPGAGHPHVSGLSPYLRHRMITEAEVLAAVTARHSPDSAEKFLLEVIWRSYWKGWLERRPSVWHGYRAGLARTRDRLATEAGLRADWEAACRGETGIDAFDAWIGELTATGYLHNHARMWVASIWIFTLRLPWELGADLFLRHLLDGDPASNTLGWRWVAGLHTPGKTYAATADNIARYTEGRFAPRGLAPVCAPVEGLPNPPLGPVPEGERPDPDAPSLLLVTEDDLCPGWLLPQVRDWRGAALWTAAEDRSPLAVSAAVRSFTQAAGRDALARLGGAAGPEMEADDAGALLDAAAAAGARQIVTAFVPQGPMRPRLDALRRAAGARGLRMAECLRGHDRLAWPQASAGFFRFKSVLPRLLEAARSGRV